MLEREGQRTAACIKAVIPRSQGAVGMAKNMLTYRMHDLRDRDRQLRRLALRA